jgi:hypothetical protein
MSSGSRGLTLNFASIWENWLLKCYRRFGQCIMKKQCPGLGCFNGSHDLLEDA